MSKERPQPEDFYGLTEREVLFDRMSTARFQSLIEDERTAIHKVELSTNSFGEFLFVSTSRAVEDKRKYLTFWGAGYHEYRERWITDTWSWYEALPPTSEQTLSKEEALVLIRQRQQEVAVFAKGETQSQRGKLFELLADLTDEDGALADLEDFPHWFDEDLE